MFGLLLGYPALLVPENDTLGLYSQNTQTLVMKGNFSVVYYPNGGGTWNLGLSGSVTEVNTNIYIFLYKQKETINSLKV